MGGCIVIVIKKLRELLAKKLKNDRDDVNHLLEVYGINDFLYATWEGLPIEGSFSDIEEVSAKLPELIKRLEEFSCSECYIIVTPKTTFTILKISREVIALITGTRVLEWDEAKRLKEFIKKELNID